MSCNKTIFNPLVLPEGTNASADPVLWPDFLVNSPHSLCVWQEVPGDATQRAMIESNDSRRSRR